MNYYQYNICNIVSNDSTCAKFNGVLCIYSRFHENFYGAVAIESNEKPPIWSLIDSNNSTAGVKLRYENGNFKG